VKDDVNQAYMQAFSKLSSGYKQAAGDDLAKLCMGDDLWVDDEDVQEHNNYNNNNETSDDVMI